MKLNIQIEPMGAVRMTNRGKWVNPAAKRYLAYKDAVGWQAKKQAKLEMPLQTAVRIKEITFIFPIPKSGRISYTLNGKRKTKKVSSGDYHTAKPDIDNLFKGVADSLNGIMWEDDGLICEVGKQRKVYGLRPGIEIEIEE